MGSGIDDRIIEFLCNPKDVKKKKEHVTCKLLRSRKYSHYLEQNLSH